MQVKFWHSFRLAGYTDLVSGYDRLPARSSNFLTEKVIQIAPRSYKHTNPGLVPGLRARGALRQLCCQARVPAGSNGAHK